MANREYIMGVIVGILLVFVIFAIIWKVSGSKSLKGDYDERQMLIRGIGYKYAFLTNLILLAVYVLSSALFPDLPVNPGEAMFAVIIISVLVYALYCIRKDAFFGIRYNSKGYLILLVAVVVTNLIGAGARLVNGEWHDTAGHLDFGFFSNSVCVIGFGVILIAILLKNAEKKREELADEES